MSPVCWWWWHIPDIGPFWLGICVCCLRPVPAEGNLSLQKDPTQGGMLRHQNYRRKCGLTSTQLIDSLGRDSLQDHHKTAGLCIICKAINRQEALSIDVMCRPDSRTRGSTQNFGPIQTKKKPFSNFSFIITIPDWNKLPSDAKLALTFTAFKAKSKKTEYFLTTHANLSPWHDSTQSVSAT